jgi:hypothetical protein
MTEQKLFTHSWQWRYGFLALLLLLLIGNLWSFPPSSAPPAAGRYSGLIISLMLIFNHIAFCLVPTGRLKTVFTYLAFAWLAFGCAYTFTRGFSRLPFH